MTVGIHYAYEGRYFITPPEDDNLINTLSEESQNDPDYFDRQDIEWPDESMTMEIAGSWSINPQDLYEKADPSPRLGLLGF